MGRLVASAGDQSNEVEHTVGATEIPWGRKSRDSQHNVPYRIRPGGIDCRAVTSSIMREVMFVRVIISYLV